MDNVSVYRNTIAHAAFQHSSIFGRGLVVKFVYNFCVYNLGLNWHQNIPNENGVNEHTCNVMKWVQKPSNFNSAIKGAHYILDLPPCLRE